MERSLRCIPNLKSWSLEPGSIPYLLPSVPQKNQFFAAAISIRIGGISQQPYHKLNLAYHVVDVHEAVDENRRRFLGTLGIGLVAANESYYVLDDTDIVASIGGKYPRSTKRYREWKAEAEESNSGKEIVSQEDWTKAHDMIQRLKDCGLYDSRFGGGSYQVEFNIDLDGVPLKGFLDCLNDDFIVDSKSSRSINKFRYDVNSFSYDIQAYVYTKVFGIKDFYWVVQEKAYPYFPADVKCSEETLFKGEMKFHEALENINNWLNKNEESNKHFAEFVV